MSSENKTHPTSSESRKGCSLSQRGSPGEQPEPLKCPRCDSSNTKFCYYNNYSLRQPRHFCKTCRRYWTHGGSLRNVPIGGASRKPNKTPRKPSSSGLDPAHIHFGMSSNASDQRIHMAARVSLSCIESLSSINQEMHWKIQHPHLVSLIYDHQDHHHNHNHQPLGEVGPTEWFFDHTMSYDPNNYETSAGTNTEVHEAAHNPDDGWSYFHHGQFNGLH